MADQGNVTVDVDADIETDSAYGASIESYRTSLNSSSTDYKWENGRRYHSYREGSYRFPNDEREQERLDMAHHMITAALDGRLYLAPIPEDEALRILDIGTGTGIWAMQIGDKLAHCHVIGNDLSPIQPRWVPSNVEFEVDDCESEWPQRPPFDFIHERSLAGSLSNWPRFMKQCHENLNPGGWVEFQEGTPMYYSEDDSIPKDSNIFEFYNRFAEACEKLGRVAEPGGSLESWVRDAGFINIHKKVLKLPLGLWPKDPRMKDIGALSMIQFEDGMEAWTLGLFTGALGWSSAQVQLFLVGLRNDLKNRKAHAMLDFYIVYAQKAYV